MRELTEALRVTADVIDNAGDVFGDTPEQFENVLLVMAARDSLCELSRLTTEARDQMDALLPIEYREAMP